MIQSNAIREQYSNGMEHASNVPIIPSLNQAVRCVAFHAKMVRAQEIKLLPASVLVNRATHAPGHQEMEGHANKNNVAQEECLHKMDSANNAKTTTLLILVYQYVIDPVRRLFVKQTKLLREMVDARAVVKKNK